MEFIDFKDMPPERNEKPCLVDYAVMAQIHQLVRLIGRNFLFPLVAAQSVVSAGALDCQPCLSVRYPDPDGPAGFAAYIALGHPAAAGSGLFVGVVQDKEFAFCFRVVHLH